MDKGGTKQPLKKSKSMFSLTDEKVPCDSSVYRKEEFYSYRRSQSSTISDSSVEICVVVDSDSEDAGAGSQLTDSGDTHKTTFDGEMQVLEQKIDKLSDMFLEQCRLLTTLKEDIRSSKAAMDEADLSQSDILADIVKNTVFQSGLIKGESGRDTKSRARTLLDAIECRQGGSIDTQIQDTLASFLQSDELKRQMVSATAESVRGVVGACLSRDLPALYLPILEHSHRRLVRQLTRTLEDAFLELEANSASLSMSVYKTGRALRRSVQRHRSLLEAAADPCRDLAHTLKCTVEQLLYTELKQWRQKVLDVFSSELRPAGAEPPGPGAEHPAAGAQPADHGGSIVDQLMTAAETSRQLDVNAIFESALAAGDLAQVMDACRSASAHTFAPRCRLRQHVLLALMQQLSTDMLRDTSLKCRYLEDCIMSVDPGNPVTRTHLPLVVGEVRKHLGNFLASHPGHAATRRIALIVMAAENLIK